MNSLSNMGIFYAASFPPLSSLDEQIIGFRDQHDPKALLVAPHVTLVYPTGITSESVFIDHVARVARTVRSFSANFATALVMPNHTSLGVTGDIFLVPDEGFGDIVRLRDKLYTGTLKTEMRLDIPFIPHLTIGSALELNDARRLVDGLNAKRFSFRVPIDHVAVVEVVRPDVVRRLAANVSLANVGDFDDRR